MNIQESNDLYIVEWQAFLHQLIKIYYEDMNKGETDLAEIRENYQQLLEKSKIENNNFAFYIKRNMNLNDDMLFFMMLGFLYEIDSKWRHFNSSNFKTNCLTFEIGFLLLQYVKDIHFSDLFQLLDIEDMKLIFVESKTDYSLQASMQLQSWILKYIDCGSFNNYLGIDNYFYGTEDYLSIMEKSYQKLKEYMNSNINFALLGSLGTGKRTLIKRFANENDMVIQFLDLDIFNSLDLYKQEVYLSYIRFFSLLYNGITVLSSTKKINSDILTYFEKLNISYIVCTSDNENIHLPMIMVPDFLNYEDMKKVIKHFELSQSILELHYNIKDLKQFSMDTYLTKSSNLYANPYVSEVSSLISRKDYICDEETSEIIDIMIYEIKHRKMIQNYLKETDHKKGLQLLFYGPSGSGKTMLASILANEINVPLYKIDLSMVNDKYIGESEKHLESIFKNAEKENCMLLFDEADVLFAKRTSINSSNDRHANTITAYLLQRIENYDGIVILTSNLVNNFDSAFMRRMSYIIRLGKPSLNMQKDKWNYELNNLIFDNDVNIDEMVANYSLTLAEIRKTIEKSVCLMLKSKKKILQKEEIIKAIRLHENSGRIRY